MSPQQTTEDRNPGPSISASWLEKLSDFIAKAMGLRFPPERWNDLERAFHSVADEFGFKDPAACAKWLSSLSLEELQSQYVETLASHLTVGETYFFRDMAAFDALERQIVPQIIRTRTGNNRHLKIWSAGCCTGEELYSIAILLSRVIPDYEDWRISLTGTDINARFLKTAAEGRYGQWSFRSTPDWIKNGYFRQKSSGSYEIFDQIKKMVQFEYLNLAKDTFPSLAKSLFGVDVVFCRNVLMYFTAESAREVLAGFYRTLVDGGWLIVSPVDLVHVKGPEFDLFSSETPYLYKKRDGITHHGLEQESTAPGGHELWTGYSIFDQYPIPDSDTLAQTPIPAESEAAIQPADTTTSGEKTGRDEPSEELSRYDRALSLYETGHYEDAIHTLKEHSAGDGRKSPGSELSKDEITLLARTCANLGDHDEAIAWCDKSISANKLDPFLYYLRATILQEDGRIDEAVKSIRQALYLDPDYAMAHFVMGNLGHLKGKREESERHFAVALRLAGKHPQDEVLPQSEDITAGRLVRIIQSITEREP